MNSPWIFLFFIYTLIRTDFCHFYLRYSNISVSISSSESDSELRVMSSAIAHYKITRNYYSMCADTVSRSVSHAASPSPALPHLASACISMCARPYCHSGCLLLLGHWYSSYSHVCNLEGLIFIVTELLTENFGPQSFQQAAYNKINVPGLVYALLRTDHIYLYCCPVLLYT